ncbi:MAG: murein transglycosylase A [Desulfovibrionaceae bacterium]|nr:murein transglycosylase A [Desulfovibrionaceae bacterium]
MKQTRFYTTTIRTKAYYIILHIALILYICYAFISCSSDSSIEQPVSPTVEVESQSPTQTQKKDALYYVLASVDEARHASSMLSPKTQGIHSFTDYSVPLERSINYLKRKKSTDIGINVANLKITYGELLATAEELQQILPLLDTNPTLLVERFDWYKPIPTILFTGYYEPIINASRKKTEKYKYPIYSTPADMRVLQLGQFHPSLQGKRIIYRIENDTPVPYYTRKEIDSDNMLKNRGLEIAYGDSLVDIFFMQIQGSGQVRYTDGSKAYLLYASQTGREYVSLGSVMQKKGHLQAGEINMFTIREFFRQNPDKIEELLNTNPSYVFFREAQDGLFGSIGQKLTPWQSIAVDSKVIPYGGIGVIDVALLDSIQDLPQYAKQTRSISGLVFAQDTGGAIRGNRIDLFCGPGDVATQVAGFLAGRNPFWLLMKKPVEERNIL